ncbi:hypothetical protein [Aurantiacibacter sp. MUD61]|uniref:hypothetical protein n=1 Tax=Aurantiacibacter sp. MUD61 TaxID=3009083 RepID=UPI0022F0318A|nr:hypothetical protein [Aurantiacibacter sp. MUD61]
MAGPLIALSLMTLGAGAAVGVQQYRKMKRKLPENNDIHPEERLQEQRLEEEREEKPRLRQDEQRLDKAPV